MDEGVCGQSSCSSFRVTNASRGELHSTIVLCPSLWMNLSGPQASVAHFMMVFNLTCSTEDSMNLNRSRNSAML